MASVFCLLAKFSLMTISKGYYRLNFPIIRTQDKTIPRVLEHFKVQTSIKLMVLVHMVWTTMPIFKIFILHSTTRSHQSSHLKSNVHCLQKFQMGIVALKTS